MIPVKVRSRCHFLPRLTVFSARYLSTSSSKYLTEIFDLRQIRRLFTHLGTSRVGASLTDTSTDRSLHNSPTILS